LGSEFAGLDRFDRLNRLNRLTRLNGLNRIDRRCSSLGPSLLAPGSWLVRDVGGSNRWCDLATVV